MKSLSAMLTALFMAFAALTASAQGDGMPGIQTSAPEPVAKDPARGSNLPLAHKVKLGLPPALTGDASAEAPKLSIELGYGKSPPPPLGSAAPANLPGEYWGHTSQRAIKANVSLGF